MVINHTLHLQLKCLSAHPIPARMAANVYVMHHRRQVTTVNVRLDSKERTAKVRSHPNKMAFCFYSINCFTYNAVHNEKSFKITANLKYLQWSLVKVSLSWHYLFQIRCAVALRFHQVWMNVSSGEWRLSPHSWPWVAAIAHYEENWWVPDI